MNTISLTETQLIAESIVGELEWQGPEGWGHCPFESLHTNPSAPTDCHVVAEKIGTLAPGIYCFHDSCKAQCEDASYRLRVALGKASPPTGEPIIRRRAIIRPKPVFNPEKLERLARKLDGIDVDWFAIRSPIRVDNRTPASFLHALYRPGEKILVFDVFESQGQYLWKRQTPFDAGNLDRFRKGASEGVWFLCAPVSGESVKIEKPEPHFSRRSFRTVTSWPYLMIESDKADPAQWLAVLAQMPLPIASICTSAARSIHALVRADAESKQEWDEMRDKIRGSLVILGADHRALKAVQLTRLPCCERLGKRDREGMYHRFPEPRLQKLLYLNPEPDFTPICEGRVF